MWENRNIIRFFYTLRRFVVIEVQHLTKRYGRVTAVDDVSFKVEPGEILGFLGPNGAGKTTTMRILTGYMPASEGRATVAGYDVFTHPIEAKRRTGYLPETPPVYPDMTVREYLDFVARIKGVPSGERKARVDAVMQRTHVADMAARHCGKLSKGYRQRVGLAQAIIHNPDVLILDEPTAGLDPQSRRELREEIARLQEDGRTVLLTTHDVDEAERLCTRVAIMDGGQIIATGDPRDLTAESASLQSISLTTRPGLDPTHVADITGIVDVACDGNTITFRSSDAREAVRALMSRLEQSGHDLVELSVRRATLEDVFLRLTGTENDR